MIIREYSSRFETPRVRISREAFENYGIEIFNNERIPFADRTGPVFAKNLVRLLVARVKKIQKSRKSFPNRIHLYELGSGSGLLAKRVLDLLRNHYPEIYLKTVLHLSDISKKMVAQLKVLEAFKEHQGHVSFEVIDATNPKLKFKPLLVYFTNLIDSIPYQRHILIKDGQIFELQIETSFKKGAQIIDATSYPPKILEQKEIAKLLSSSDIKRRLILAPQILPVLEEKTRAVPIRAVKNIHLEERKDLEELAASRRNDRPSTFNYSYPAREAVREIIQGLEEGGFLFFSDFGVVSKEHELFLSYGTEYGSVVFFSVDFLGFVQLAENVGKNYYLTANSPGLPQEMLIDTIQNDAKMEGLFKKKSMGDLPEQVTDFLENAKITISESGSIATHYNSLPKEVKRDYLLLNSLALFLLQAKFYNEAAIFADILYKNYGHAVGVIYYLAKGKSEQERGKFEAAEEFFKKAASQKGFLAYAYLSELYWQQKRYLEYIDIVKKYLKYTRRGDYLKGMLSIAAAQEKLYEGETTKKTLKSLIRIGRRLKNLSESDKEILKMAESRLAF